MDELSPVSPLAAIYDGETLRVYDYSKKAFVGQQPVGGGIEGIWWADRTTLILGKSVLSGERRFLKLSIADGTLADVTDQLRPISNWMWKDPFWFKSVLGRREK